MQTTEPKFCEQCRNDIPDGYEIDGGGNGMYFCSGQCFGRCVGVPFTPNPGIYKYERNKAREVTETGRKVLFQLLDSIDHRFGDTGAVSDF